MKPKLPKLSGKYGAPMGRHSHGTLENVAPGTLHIQRLALDEGYDAGGAYWDDRRVGASLWWLSDGGDYSHFVDGSSPERVLIEMGVGEYPQLLADQTLVPTMVIYVTDTMPDQWGRPGTAPL